MVAGSAANTCRDESRTNDAASHQPLSLLRARRLNVKQEPYFVMVSIPRNDDYAKKRRARGLSSPDLLPVESRCGVQVADRNRQCIRCVKGLRRLGEFQQTGNHVLNLLFFSTAIAYDR